MNGKTVDGDEYYVRIEPKGDPEPFVEVGQDDESETVALTSTELRRLADELDKAVEEHKRSKRTAFIKQGYGTCAKEVRWGHGLVEINVLLSEGRVGNKISFDIDQIDDTIKALKQVKEAAIK